MSRAKQLLSDLPPEILTHPKVIEARSILIDEPRPKTGVEMLDELAGSAAARLEETAKVVGDRLSPVVAEAAEAVSSVFAKLAGRMRGTGDRSSTSV
jgi:hypothetical protein